MQEIKVENELNVKIFINGEPDCTLVLEDSDSGFIEALEMQISEYFKSIQKCYGPQKLDKEIITLFVNEFGTVPGSFRLE